MVRVITGTAKNTNLKVPEIEGYRAVQEVAKGSLFSIIGEKIVHTQCLDLFSGSGNLGIEALSRDAAWCDFVDESQIATRVISDNLAKCKLEEKAEVFTRDSVKYVANTEKSYDIIFVDPFYNTSSHVFLMQNLKEILAVDGLIVFFHGDNLDINRLIKDNGLKVVDERRFGKSYFTILK